MQENTTYSVGLYLRLSKDDEQQGESVSIGTQRSILTDYCMTNHYSIHKIYIDDGYSGLNFERPGFRELLEDVERGLVNMVITKDLSRLGRDYIMTGYYSEIFFQTKGVRYIAIADDFDSDKGGNEIAPFKNILNDMYARDISKKIRNAKHQRAKQGLFISGQTPYGYQKDPRNRNQLIIDPEAAAVVRIIFSLAESGMGSVAIASELKARRIVTPSVYKYQRGDERFARYSALKNGDHCTWCATTISQILKNPVYTGTLINLKTEVVNYKTKQCLPVPLERQIVTPNAHEAIIDEAQFQRVQEVRAENRCTANDHRFNLFRGKLFCECCGHPLQISRKKLKYREADMYLCMYHYSHPEVCPKTHRVYHEMLYPYVLQQVQTFAKSMKRRKVNSKISEYATIQELTPEVLDAVIERIEIGHVKYKSKPGNVIRIYWKLK
jgi:DNA invertase Pin-like site-specific DNA recombinase